MRNKILLVVGVLFGLMFINSGLNKFFNYMPIPENLPEPVLNAMTGFMELGWLLPLVGFAEIVGGVLFAIPRYRALGAMVLFPLIMGIVLFHSVQAPSGIIMALVVLAIEVWVIIENWNKYLPMIRQTEEK